MSNKTKLFDTVFKEVIKRNDFVIFDPSTEDVDLSEIKYFCFTDYSSESFKINNIQDASKRMQTTKSSSVHW